MNPEQAFSAETSFQNIAELWQTEISKSISVTETLDPQGLKMMGLMAAGISGSAPHKLDAQIKTQIIADAKQSFADMQFVAADEGRIANKGEYFLTGTNTGSSVYQQRAQAAAAQIAINNTLLTAYRQGNDLTRTSLLKEYSQISFSRPNEKIQATALAMAYLLALQSEFPAATESTIGRQERQEFEKTTTKPELPKAMQVYNDTREAGEQHQMMVQEAMQRRDAEMNAAYQEWQKQKQAERRQQVVAQNADLTKGGKQAGKILGWAMGGAGAALAALTIAT